MTTLTLYNRSDATTPVWHSEHIEDIQAHLRDIGVRFERWQASHPLSANPAQEEVIAAYQHEIDKLVAEAGYQSWDVASIRPDNPQKEQMRSKFLAEHTHSDDEVRFFVEGTGLFCLHLGDTIAQILCEKNDLIAVPAGTLPWFEMGSEPYFTAIRLFNNTEGWVANFTGDAIAEQFPTLA
jgi:1,2-dihydroxy-3-keto-5-methylthiopentene dioxygenase